MTACLACGPTAGSPSVVAVCLGCGALLCERHHREATRETSGGTRFGCSHRA